MTTLVETFGDERPALNFRQRWGSYLAIAFAALAVLAGALFRANSLGAVATYTNPEAGIEARYPAAWLLTEGGEGGEFVFRAQDSGARPYKTLLQLRLIPTGPGVRPGDVLNLLDLDRAGHLAAYRSLMRSPVSLPDGRRGTRMTYSYAYINPDPFLQAEPVTVRAVDVVVLRPAQAVVITFESDAAVFEENVVHFEAFLNSLVF
jgi:hypothetical protein